MTVTVSVVMPVYNSASFLSSAMDSLLRQTFSDFEILAFDDGSTDGSIEILEGYASLDTRVKPFFREHCGYSPHLNEGIQVASGEFIARMDSDDVCSIQRFEKQVLFLKTFPEIVAVGSWYDFIDAEGLPFTRFCPPTTHDEIDQLHLKGQGGTMGHPTILMRTATVREIGGYRTKFEPAEDLDLLLRLGEIGKLANIDEPLLGYRVHDQSIGSLKRNRQLECNAGILEDAWRRRNLPGSPPNQQHGQRTRLDDPDFFRERYQKSLNSRFFRTARRYSIRQLRRQPWSSSSWMNLFRAWYASLRMEEASSVTKN